MKLITYLKEGHEQLAMLADNFLYDLDTLHPELPSSMSMMLNYWEDYFPLAQAMDQSIKAGKISAGKATPVEGLGILPPITQPTSFRQAYAFNQFVEAAQQNQMPAKSPAFEQYSIFHFANHHSIQGPGTAKCMPDHFAKLDFGLQLAIVICKHGRNILVEEADEYIGGFMIMNTLCARHLQMEGRASPFLQAKGHDFATLIGPWLVTPDELESAQMETPHGHTGNTYNLTMKCWVNDELVAETSSSGMNWTFAEIIERCSYGADVFPGDIIGSGTAGGGSFLELNRKGKITNPDYPDRWLREGDVAEVEVDLLGRLRATIVAEESEHRLPEQQDAL